MIFLGIKMRTISDEFKVVSGRRPLSVNKVFDDPNRLTRVLAHLPNEEEPRIVVDLNQGYYSNDKFTQFLKVYNLY